MLSASKTYLNEKIINTTSNIYLAGYAEGGTATLALQRLLEEEKTESLKKTLVGNGPYAKRLWAKERLFHFDHIGKVIDRIKKREEKYNQKQFKNQLSKTVYFPLYMKF